ncbi:hypothetical protein BC628DRAFT_1167624 [Trametes gibbosa]|nr:hypothetical protein BC628DRAFT_1167624 [Trametes gibbosa]
MTRILQSSRARLARSGTRLVQGLRERSSWFVHNIIAARPVSDQEAWADCSSPASLNGLGLQEASPRANPRFHRRHPRATRLSQPGHLQVMVARQEVLCSDSSDEGACAEPVPPSVAGGRTLKSVRKLTRIGGRSVVASNILDEDECGSDSEDFGRVHSTSPLYALTVDAKGVELCQPYSMVDENSFDPSEYHTAISHLTDPSGMENPAVPQFVDESSGAVFVRIAMGLEEHFHPTNGSIAGELHTPCPCASSSIPDTAPNFLTVPSLMLTLPTPQIAQSPVFRPCSPITLFKYVEATTPTHEFGEQPILCSSTGASLSPAPSIPACDRCCLAQLEDGLICRACEKQWLACKMWYQAHDGGRRRWLTAPYITPAESTARIRAVMGLLGVPGTSASARPHLADPDVNRGLGLGSSVSFKKELPFRVLATASGSSGSHVQSGSRLPSGGTSTRTGTGNGTWATRLGYQIAGAKRVAFLRQDSMALGAARKGLRALCSVSAGVLLAGPFSRDVCTTVPSRTGLHDWSDGVRIAGHRRAPSSTGSISSGTGSIPSCGPGSTAETVCITSGSRYVEHLPAL